VYTAGYGNRQFNEFVALLTENKITLVIDVRSKPYSGWNGCYNKPYLMRNMPMRYWSWGEDCLGGMEDVPKEAFQIAIDEIVMLSRQERICLMCSEKQAEPSRYLKEGCHRWRVIAPALEKRGVTVIHL